jgi:hypothetical protein
MSHGYANATTALSQSVSADGAIHCGESGGAGKGNRTPLASLEG